MNSYSSSSLAQLDEYTMNLTHEKKIIRQDGYFCPTSEILEKASCAILNFFIKHKDSLNIQVVDINVMNKNSHDFIDFYLYMKPEVRLTRIFKSEFFIPFPHRYLILRIERMYHSLRSIRMTTPGLVYSSEKLVLKTSLDKYSIGSFLPNSQNNQFCLNADKEITAVSNKICIEALEKMLLSFYYSNYNSDWSNNLFGTKSFFLIYKAFSKEVNIKDLDIILQKPKWSLASSLKASDQYNPYSYIRCQFPKEEYKALMHCLSAHPDFWEKADYSLVSSSSRQLSKGFYPNSLSYSSSQQLKKAKILFPSQFTKERLINV